MTINDEYANMTFTDLSPEAEAQVIAQLDRAGADTAGDDIKVVAPVELTLDTAYRVRQAAKARGMATAELLSSWIEDRLAVVEADHPISLADALAALSRLRNVA